MSTSGAPVILSRAVIAALIAALFVSVWESIAVAGGDVGVGSTLLPLLALYAIPALIVGIAAGVFMWSWQSEFGERALNRGYRELLADKQAEARAVGVVFAVFALALVVAIVGFVASLKLVAGVERKGIGAILAAVATVCALPIGAIAALPAYRLGKAAAPVIPRLGPIARPLVLVLAVAGVGLLGALWVVTTKLDWRALPLGPPIAAAVYGLLFLALLPLVKRIRPPSLVLGVAAGLVVLVLANLPLSTSPSTKVASAITERSRGAGLLVRVARSRIDGDGDGVSAFFAGPDCNDSDPRVFPGATEVPDNGIDDNCEFGDRVSKVQEPGDGDGSGSGANGPTGPTSPTRTRPPPAKHLLFVVVDTLRADRLGSAGYRRDGQSLTPELDKFAEGATVFSKTYAQAPNTPRSFPSFFTSQYPSQVKVDKSYANYSKMLPENISLWEVLSDAGIHTAGLSSHFYFSEERGIRQGFAEYDNEGAKNISGSNKDIASPRTVPKAIAKLKALAATGDRFALFVHLFEPHSTYLAHPEYPITERGVPSLVQKYDFEIKFVDVWIGKLLAGLAEAGVANDTLVVIASDHGEAFGVHRVAGKKMFFHGQTLYDELLRVPLLIRAPGGKPAIADDVVMMIDAAPSIVDLLGLSVPDEFVGRSLAPRVFGQDLKPQPAYAELIKAPSWPREAKAMIDGDGKSKAIYSITDGRWEIFDLSTDPTEMTELSSKNKGLTDSLKDKLGRFIEVDLPSR